MLACVAARILSGFFRNRFSQALITLILSLLKYFLYFLSFLAGLFSFSICSTCLDERLILKLCPLVVSAATTRKVVSNIVSNCFNEILVKVDKLTMAVGAGYVLIATKGQENIFPK